MGPVSICLQRKRLDKIVLWDMLPKFLKTVNCFVLQNHNIYHMFINLPAKLYHCTHLCYLVLERAHIKKVNFLC